MNVENMLALSYFLDGLDSENFDFSDWAAMDGHKLGIGQFISYINKAENSCGTTACLAGWAVYLFSRDVGNQSDIPLTVQVPFTPVDYTHDWESEHKWGSYRYDFFATIWLGLTHEQSSKLFYCDEGSLWDIHSDDYEITRDCELCGHNSGIENEYPVYVKRIHPKHAADLLRRLALGEISFPESDY